MAYPDRGLLMIWERLDDCFDALEVVESSLLRTLETFPKILNKEWKKLRELGHLLMEASISKNLRECFWVPHAWTQLVA